jgi:hypothetical protein
MRSFNRCVGETATTSLLIRLLDSVEGKSNQSGIRYKDGRVEWNGLTLPVNLRPQDEYAQMALAASRVKYCRLTRKVVRGKMRFFVQLIMEGLPPRKIDRNTGLWKQPVGQETVGLDIGTQTLAICSASQVRLVELAPLVPRMETEKRRLLRKLDRQRRANNPHKYHPDGTVKRGNRERWHHSQNYRKTLWRVKEIARKQAAVRKQDHNRLAAFVLSLGTTVYVEDMRYHALARRTKETTVNPKTGRCRSKKRFGRSIAQRAPALFLSLLSQKLKREGASLWKVATARLKASRYNHLTDTCEKASLSERWKTVSTEPRIRVQRDLYSAFLLMHTTPSLDVLDRAGCLTHFDAFLPLHDQEIERLRSLPKPQLYSMGV